MYSITKYIKKAIQIWLREMASDVSMIRSLFSNVCEEKRERKAIKFVLGGQERTVYSLGEN